MLEIWIQNDPVKVEMDLLERNAARAWRFSQFKGWEHQMLSDVWSAVREGARAVCSARPSAPTVPSTADRRAEA